MQKYGGANMWRLYGENLTGDREYYLASEADVEIAKRDARIAQLEEAIRDAVDSMYSHDVFQRLQTVL